MKLSSRKPRGKPFYTCGPAFRVSSLGFLNSELET
jgi:hypothetical protein